MPRSSPLPPGEREIGKRIIEAREAYELTRADLARDLMVDTATLGRIEQGRVPLRYAFGRRFWLDRIMPELNPLFITEGLAPLSLGFRFSLPIPEKVAQHKDALFSEVVLAARPSLLSLLGDPKLQWLPPEWLEAQKVLADTIGSEIETKHAELQKARDRIILWRDNFSKAEIKCLTNDSTGSNKTAMSSELRIPASIPALLARLRTLTKERGSKMELAKFVPASPSRISEWLRGTKEPGGHATLRLQQWVLQHERTQK